MYLVTELKIKPKFTSNYIYISIAEGGEIWILNILFGEYQEVPVKLLTTSKF